MTNLATELARTCPNTFNELVVSNQDDPSKRIVQADFQEEAHYVLSQHRFVVWEWPREHGKTEQIIGRVVHELGKRPWMRIVFVCANNDESKKRIAVTSQYIQSYTVKQIFPWLMPAQRGEWSTNALFVQRFTREAIARISTGEMTPQEAYRAGLVVISKDPSVEARSILGAGTGSRADLIVYDDPCDFANTIGRPGLRPLLIAAYTDNWEQISTKIGGRQWYLGTPWAEDDLLAYMKSIAVKIGSKRDQTEPESTWRHYRRATGRGEKYGEDEPLWPERIGVVELNAALDKIGASSYARAYQLKSVSDEDRMFSETALQNIKPIQQSTLHKTHEGYYGLPTFAGLDLAVSSKKTADNRVLTTILLQSDGCRVLMEQQVGKWDGAATADVVIDTYLDYGWREIKVENNGMQQLFFSLIGLRCKERVANGTLKAGVHINAQPFTTTALNKWDEAVGLPSLAAEMEAGMWQVVLPEDHSGRSACTCWFCELLVELRGFRNNGTSAAKHDDRVMSCWFARESVRMMGVRPAVIGENTRKLRQPTGGREGISSKLRGWRA